MSTRRDFIAAAASFTLLPVAGVRAQTEGLAQVVGAYRRGVGDIVVTALLDGFLQLDPTMLTGSDQVALGPILAQNFLGAGPVDTSINAYVIQTGERTILVDGGAASAFGPTAGHADAALAAAGVSADQVDTVFATHLHPDHVGLFTADGVARFPNAELALLEAERAFWTEDANFSGADDQTKSFAQLAQSAASAYRDRLKPMTNGADLAPGVRVMHFPGHTPGHAGLMVSSGDASLLLWGDIVHIGPVQFAKPGLTIPFDVDQPLAAETRASVFDMAANERLEIGGSHVDFPSFGHVYRRGDGYGFAPARWDHQL